MRTLHRARSTRSDSRDRGVVAIEFVLVAPFLVALIVAIASFGAYFSQKVDVTSAARDAARTLALRKTPTYPSGMTASSVTTCAAGDTTNNASVTLTATYTFSIPFVPIGTKTISATGTMRCGG
jgi:Flp pilus assembly protein TadG